MAHEGEGPRVLGPREAEVMATLWAAPSGLTVREVLDRLNGGDRPELAYTTVMTVMARLAEKGVLRRERAGRGFRYVPVVRDPAGIAVREVVRNFGETALAPFVDEARADPRMLRRLRKLLQEP
jgi:predicted transcriptional regulator